MFLGQENPLAQWIEPRRNSLLGLGSDLLSGNIGGGGVMAGKQMDDANAIRAQEEETRQARMAQAAAAARQSGNEQLAQLFESGMAMGDAIGLNNALNPQAGSKDNLMNTGGHIYNAETGEWISPPATDNRQNVSLTPQWGLRRNPQTGQDEWVMLQPSSTGDLVESQVPDGVNLVNPFDLNAQKAGGTALGKEVGGAVFSVPQAELTVQQTLRAIDDVRAEQSGMEEQFGNFLGIPQQMTPAIPGSEKAKFQVAVDRATNRAFLEARQMLKGGGQITDFESRKAEAAITNIQMAMEKGDRAQFEKALADFEQAVQDGLAKLKQQASIGGGASSTSPGGGSADPLGIR